MQPRGRGRGGGGLVAENVDVEGAVGGAAHGTNCCTGFCSVYGTNTDGAQAAGIGNRSGKRRRRCARHGRLDDRQDDAKLLQQIIHGTRKC